ncbi:hypothetical protein PS2_037409 [Malus domestica]
MQVSRNTKVDLLINHNSGNWDIDFLKPFISMVEYKAILETHIGDLMLWDRLVWPLDKKGLYSVKSGYHRVHSQVISRTNLRSSSSITIRRNRLSTFFSFARGWKLFDLVES